MKKLAAITLAAVLAFGWAMPAFAAGPHHGAGRCLDYSELCQGVARYILMPSLQSLDERLNEMLAQVNQLGERANVPSADASADTGRGMQSGRQVDTNATSPSLCARGACGLYLDENGDGICDYHGENCTNMGGNYVDADGDGVCDNFGTNRQGAGNGAADGTGAGYGSHHGSGHHTESHGGRHR